MADIINQGVKTKVLLLSATPVNNTLKDLRNQISFITGDDDTAFKNSLGVQNVQETLRVAQSQFNDWAKKSQTHRRVEVLMATLSSSLFTLLDGLTIARSRRHILHYYANSIEALGGFPKRKKPRRSS